MSFNYDDRTVWLHDLTEPVSPGLTPPVGWTLIDRRQPIRPLFVSLEVA